MDQLELDKLSNAEIKELWQKTVSEARKQRGIQLAQVQAQTDLGIDDEQFYIDAWGNRIDGTKPAPKKSGHYVGPDGYVRELAPGEKPPALSGNGIVDWLNNQDIASDPELMEALGADNLFFEEEVRIGDSDVLLKGKLMSDGWHVVSRSTSTATDNLKFRLGRSLTREQAVEQSVGYVTSKAGPLFPEISDEQIRICERLACTDRNAAFVYFLQARLPEDIADRFLELGAAGDEMGIHALAAQEVISQIAEEAVMNAFHFANPRCTEEFFDYVRSHDGNRTWTFNLLDNLWLRYQAGSAINHLAHEEQPSAAEVVEAAELMSDEELQATLVAARKLRSRSGY
jgi:hypothetical protein